MKQPLGQGNHLPTELPEQFLGHDSTEGPGAQSLIAYAVHGFFFACWVAICSAAPELIWQGFLTVLHHFDGITVGSALLVGAIIAFFVEPLTERLRAKRIKLTHKQRTTTHATLTAFGFAVLAVLVHDAITTYLATSYAGHEEKDKLVYAITEVSQWAWIPFVTTMAWLYACKKWWVAIPVLLLTLVATMCVGFVFRWYTIDIFTTTIPCVSILLGGFYIMRRQFSEKVLLRCTIMTAAIALVWLASMGFLQATLSLFATKTLRVYTWGEYAIDCRFYLGWIIGLMVAPSPIPDRFTASS